MAIKLDDGTMAPFSVLTSSDAKDPDTGTTLTFSQQGTTNTYLATRAMGDGRTVYYRFDKPTDPICVVSRKVQ